VPERGIDAFAVGIDTGARRSIGSSTSPRIDEGTIKVPARRLRLRKTFTARLALLDAQDQNFVTSFVVVSDNDLHFHRFDDVYRKVMTELGTASCPARRARRHPRPLDRQRRGRAYQRRRRPRRHEFRREGAATHRGRSRIRHPRRRPQDFVRVVQAIFDLKQRGDAAEAGALTSWLCGSGNVAGTVKKHAGIKGDIGSRDALAYLRGVLEIAKALGYKGMLIVIDEAETILRMRKDSRHKSR